PPPRVRRRGTPGTAGPHGLVCESGKHTRGLHRRSRKFPGVPRAVFLGLLRKTPGGLAFRLVPGFCPEGQSLSTAAGFWPVAPPDGAAVQRPPYPSDVRAARQDPAAWAASGRVRYARDPKPPLPARTSKRFATRPSLG